MSNKELELLREKRFVFLDGKISIQYYEMPQDRLSLRDLSELFSGGNDYFPDMHRRMPNKSDFELFFYEPVQGDAASMRQDYELYFYEPAGYEKLTFKQYYNLLRSPEMNKKLFGLPETTSPLRAAVRSLRDDIQMGLWLNIIDRKPDEVALEWFVAAETEASTSMLHFLISSSYQNGMIYPVTIERMDDVSS